LRNKKAKLNIKQKETLQTNVKSLFVGSDSNATEIILDVSFNPRTRVECDNLQAIKAMQAFQSAHLREVRDTSLSHSSVTTFSFQSTHAFRRRLATFRFSQRTNNY